MKMAATSSLKAYRFKEQNVIIIDNSGESKQTYYTVHLSFRGKLTLLEKYNNIAPANRGMCTIVLHN